MCRDGSEQPSKATLAQCLKSILDLPGQVPAYIIIDDLDECPNNSSAPSARENVLNFIEDLMQSNHSNLIICITSGPEQDINTVLNPLISSSRRISLHKGVEDKELIIRVLSERAQGM